MMSADNGFTTISSSCLVNVDANNNQVLPTTSETITEENKITINESFINQVKKYL
jgi:hypothetical protein